MKNGNRATKEKWEKIREKEQEAVMENSIPFCDKVYRIEKGVMKNGTSFL